MLDALGVAVRLGGERSFAASPTTGSDAQEAGFAKSRVTVTLFDVVGP